MIKSVQTKVSITYVLNTKNVVLYDNYNIEFTEVLYAIVLSTECEKANIKYIRTKKSVSLLDAHIEITYSDNKCRVQITKYL